MVQARGRTRRPTPAPACGAVPGRAVEPSFSVNGHVQGRDAAIQLAGWRSSLESEPVADDPPPRGGRAEGVEPAAVSPGSLLEAGVARRSGAHRGERSTRTRRGPADGQPSQGCTFETLRLPADRRERAHLPPRTCPGGVARHPVRRHPRTGRSRPAGSAWARPPARLRRSTRCGESGSVRAALEDVGIGHLHRAAALRGGERPAPDVLTMQLSTGSLPICSAGRAHRRPASRRR